MSTIFMQKVIDFYLLLKSKSLSGKYSLGMLTKRQKLLYHVKQSATDALKTSSKRIIQKTAEATGDLIGNKITNKLI